MTTGVPMTSSAAGVTLPTNLSCNISDHNRWHEEHLLPNGTMNCDSMFQAFLDKHQLRFDVENQVRIGVTWSIFLISFLGNLIVLASVTAWRKNNYINHTQLIMLHISLANLVFTTCVLPMDAIWQTTLQWYGGDGMCRLMNMLKQFAMIISSAMIAVMELDRAIGLLRPASGNLQRKRLKLMLAVTWTLCFLYAVPAGVVFAAMEHFPDECFCPELSVTQCVDFMMFTQNPMGLKIYHFYTLFMTFIVPVVMILLCFIIIAVTIAKMAKKARATELQSAGFRDRRKKRKGLVRKSLDRARRVSQMVTGLITLTFLVCWGPYYVVGIIHWHNKASMNHMAQQIMLMTLYLNPCFHPVIIVILLKDVRRNLDCKFPCFLKFGYVTPSSQAARSPSVYTQQTRVFSRDPAKANAATSQV